MTTASMTTASHPVLAALRGIVGSNHVLVEGDLSAFEQDWRGRHRGHALAVVRPGSTREVAAVVRACAMHGVALVPQGGNTGLVNGSVPDASGNQVLLNMGRMNRVREIDPANLTMTVEAGCILQGVQQAADEAGLLFPLSLAAEGSCTIGGNLATNAGGTQVLRYGNARELCLGLEVVTASGETWSALSGLRKDNSGYDLRDLFIGSEGTLGVITAATLKLYPRPAAIMTALASCSSMADARALLHLARQSAGPALTAFELMNSLSLDLVRRHFPELRQPLPAAPWTVLIELSDSENETHARGVLEHVLGSALESGLVTNAVVAETLQQSHDLWHLRETITLAQAREGLNARHDIALPISRIPDFCEATDQAIAQAFPGIRLVNFGHLGDGNLHYNFLAPEQADSASWIRLHESRITSMVYAAVTEYGGSISAEHGIGIVKRDALMRHKSPVALNLMAAIKHALDPNGLFNPGCVLATASHVKRFS